MPVNRNITATSRSLKKGHPDNQNLYLDDKKFLELLREVKIRFDTNPKFYQREDYLKLIELFRKLPSGGGSVSDWGAIGGNIENQLDLWELILEIRNLIPEYEVATEEDVELLVDLLPEMVTEIVNEIFDNSCLESFTGNSLYVPMKPEEVHNIIENVFNNEEEYGTSDSEP